MYSALTRENVSCFLAFFAITNKKSIFVTKKLVLRFKRTNAAAIGRRGLSFLRVIYLVHDQNGVVQESCTKKIKKLPLMD